MQGPFIDFLRIVQDHRLLCNICGEGRLLWRIFRSLTSTLQMPNSPIHAYDTKFLVKREHCHAADPSSVDHVTFNHVHAFATHLAT